jgi:poly-beta-1,6-N-acetyl-D-glucosamine synthase
MYIILFIFLFCILTKVWFSFYFFRKILYSSTHTEYMKEPVSIVICARDEATNLQIFLPKILSQKDVVYEVIIINQASIDNTNKVLEKFQSEYQNLKVIHIEASNGVLNGKKYALYTGILNSANSVIVCTDADCEVGSEYWLRNMIKHFTSLQTDIVLGYSPIITHTKNIMLKYVTSIDQMYNSLLYLSFAKSGKAYMGVGRNVAFRKEIIKEEYWKKYAEIDYADDDMILQNYAKIDNVVVEIGQESHVYTAGKETFKEYILQKIRHISAGKYYKPQIVFLLGLYQLVNILSFILLIYIIFGHVKIWLTIFAVLTYVFSSYINFSIGKKVGIVSKIYFFGLILVEWLVILILLLMPFISIGSKNKWRKNIQIK